MKVLLPLGQSVDFDMIDPIVESIAEKFVEQDVYCHDCWSAGCLCLAATMSACVLQLDKASYLTICQSWWRDCGRATVEMGLVDKHLVTIHGEQPWTVAALLKPALTDGLPNYFGGLLASGISYFSGFTQMKEVNFLETCELMRERVDRQRAKRAELAERARKELH